MSAILSPEFGTTDITPYLARALDDLTEQLMDGKQYPRRTPVNVNRLDILRQCDHGELVDVICLALARHDFRVLEGGVEVIIRAHLHGSSWVQRRAEELAAEEKEEA